MWLLTVLGYILQVTAFCTVGFGAIMGVILIFDGIPGTGAIAFGAALAIAVVLWKIGRKIRDDEGSWGDNS